MRKEDRNLIVLNYQFEVPPFLIDFFKESTKHYDKIYYITPSLKRDNSNILKKFHIEVHQIHRIFKYINLIKMILLTFLKKRYRKMIFLSIKNKDFSYEFLKTYFQQTVCGYILHDRVRKIFRRNQLLENKTHVVSAWFSAEAYAASLLKVTFPHIKTVSLAHSFDANPYRNPKLLFSFPNFKHRNLNNIYFISSTIMNYYIEKVAVPLHIDTSNMRLLKLGISNDSGVTTETSRDDILRILSVSSVNDVKQVIEIPKSLKEINAMNIQWTHIGDGPLMQNLKDYSEQIKNSNKNLEIILLGYKTNNEVHLYYQNSQVDIFVNVSKIEGVPVSIMEAISYGIPVIATDVGGTSEIVKITFGELINAEKVNQELKLSIKNFTNKSIETKEKMRKDAYDFWKENYDSSKNYFEFFESLNKS